MAESMAHKFETDMARADRVRIMLVFPTASTTATTVG